MESLHGNNHGPAQVYPGGEGISRAFGQVSAGSGLSRQYHTNTHGDIAATSDSAQNTETTYDYNAFGNRNSGSAASNPYDYAGDSGYWRDADTGLMYVRQRWYDPSIGMWQCEECQKILYRNQYVFWYYK